MSDQGGVPTGPQPRCLPPVDGCELDAVADVYVAMQLGVAAPQITPGEAAVGQGFRRHDESIGHSPIVDHWDGPVPHQFLRRPHAC